MSGESLDIEVSELAGELENVLAALRQLVAGTFLEHVTEQLSRFQENIERYHEILGLAQTVAASAQVNSQFNALKTEIESLEALPGVLHEQLQSYLRPLRELPRAIDDAHGEVRHSIAEFVESGADSIEEFEEGIKDAVDEAADTSLEAIKELQSEAESAVSEAASGLSDDLESNSQGFMSSVGERLTQTIDTVSQSADELTQAFGNMSGALDELFTGLGAEYAELATDLTEASGGLQMVSDILTDIKATLDTVF